MYSMHSSSLPHSLDATLRTLKLDYVSHIAKVHVKAILRIDSNRSLFLGPNPARCCLLDLYLYSSFARQGPEIPAILFLTIDRARRRRLRKHYQTSVT